VIDLYTNGSQHQTRGMRLLQQGIEAAGETGLLRMITGTYAPARACVLWGTRYLKELKQRYPVQYILEAGYFRDRLAYYSLGIGGLNGRADFNNQDRPSDRWLMHGVPRQPWKDRGQGKYVLVIGQVPGDMATRGVNLQQWYDSIIDAIRLHTNLPIYYRAHPQALRSQPSNGKCLVMPNIDLKDALADAAYVVTYNSNTGVEAAIAGVPVYTQDPGAMAWPIAAHTLESLFNFGFPDRSQWLYNLAYCQWSADELADGTAWGHICRKHDDEIATPSAGQALNR